MNVRGIAARGVCARVCLCVCKWIFLNSIYTRMLFVIDCKYLTALSMERRPLGEIDFNSNSTETKKPTMLSIADIYNLVYFVDDFELDIYNHLLQPHQDDTIVFTVELLHRELLKLLEKFILVRHEGSSGAGQFKPAPTPTFRVEKCELTKFLVTVTANADLVEQFFPSEVTLVLTKSEVFKMKAKLKGKIQNCTDGDETVVVTSNGYLVRVLGSEIPKLIPPGVNVEKMWRVRHQTPTHTPTTIPRSRQLETPPSLSEPTGESQIPPIESTGNSSKELQITRQLKLTKVSVSYLIGKGGDKIQSLRQTSNCKIKVLDCNEDDSKSLFHSRRRIQQDIVIQGTEADVISLTQWIKNDLKNRKA